MNILLLSADPSRMLGERAGEDCTGDRDRQTDRLALAAGSCIFLDFILGSESNVRHWQGVTQVTIRHALTGG